MITESLYDLWTSLGHRSLMQLFSSLSALVLVGKSLLELFVHVWVKFHSGLAQQH